jgi:hypothetical protein
MNKLINKILSFFGDSTESEELEAMRHELRLVTAECATLVDGIKFYASMPDSAESRQALIRFTEDNHNYAKLYLQHVDELKEELETLKRTVRISARGH